MNLLMLFKELSLFMLRIVQHLRIENVQLFIIKAGVRL
jgi:hypothetical protein